ncbi:MAG: lysine--tRNA ligase [Firmicutes bacterium]|nr:lysine--tRNA ligase [Bacillota bacterium]
MSDENRQNRNNQEADLSELLRLRREKLGELQQGGNDPFRITSYEVTAHSRDIVEHFEETEGQTFSIAGRLMSKRVMGKASFCHLQDREGQIQIYVRRDDVGDDGYAFFKKMIDVGDIVGAKGHVFKTQKGEVSLHLDSITLLSKSLQMMPEKFHGLTDKEARYRQRYVDLMMNQDSMETFVKRSRILKELRAFLDGRGFLEVDTPVLTPFEIGASAKPFYTHLNALDMDMVLRIETELYLKRLIVGGMERVYEVGRIFRNEGMDLKHNPEFTTIELYQAYTDFHGMMDLVEDMMKYVAEKVCGTLVVPFMGQQIDLGNWQRLTMKEAVLQYSGVNFDDWKTDEDAIAAAKAHDVALPEVPTRGAILAEFFDAFVEEKLIQPTFIYDYPVEISPLAKRKPDDPEFTERFEYFINAIEFGNAFSELNDPIDQRARFERQVEERRQLDPASRAEVDYDFINALEYGMPPTGGLGFGVDRLCMLLTNQDSIREVLLFPTMKSLKTGSEQQEKEKEEAEKTPEATPAAPEKIDFSNVVIEPLFEDQVDFETFSKSDFRAVKVLECEAVPKSKKLLKFTLDDGSGELRTILSGIHAYYEPEELIGKTCIAITNLPPRKMMGIDSCGMLISAVNKRGEDEELHLLMVDPHIPAGAKLY